jgi:HSP20 family protein
MDKLAKVQKNGSLAHHNNAVDFPMWSSFIDDLFKTVEPPLLLGAHKNNQFIPKVNIRDAGEAYIVDMAVPGMRKKDFSIELENEVLKIASKKVTHEVESHNESYLRREFGFAEFERSFTLPDTIDEEKIKASYANGILSVHLFKKEEAKPKPPRTITIS